MPNSEIPGLIRISAPTVAALSPALDTTSDQLNWFYKPVGIPFVRHSPLPVQAQSAAGAAGKSISQKISLNNIVGTVRNQAQIAPSIINAGIVPTLLASTSTTTISNLVFLCGTATSSTSGTDGQVLAAANAIDGNLSTFAKLKINTAGSANAAATLTLAGVPSVASGGGLVLFVKSAVPTNNITGGNIANVAYSFDGGNSFTNFFNLGATTTRGVTTDSVPIPTNINLALIQVQGFIQRGSGISQSGELDLYEAYIGTA